MRRAISRLLLGLAIAMTMVLASVGSAYGSAITIDGPWYQFSFAGAGALARGCLPQDPSGFICDPNPAGNSVHAGAPAWTFTASADGAVLTVTDAFLAGDVFRIFDFGVLIGMTSLVETDPSHNCGANPVPCLADPLISSGIFFLGAGNHSITIRPVESPYGPGSAYFRVDTIPEPASLALLGSGLAGLGIALRRRRRAGWRRPVVQGPAKGIRAEISEKRGLSTC